MSLINFKIVDNGDSALTICFNEPISEQLTRKIISIEQMINQLLPDVLLDVIPSYQSITIIFLLENVSKKIVLRELQSLLIAPIIPSNYQSKLLEIPVCYGGSFGPDLNHLSNYCHLSNEQIIDLHTQQVYLVHMLGFLPGFLYLGGLNKKLFCPRKNNPELKVAKGSVGIGGQQTGIYPIESPGGWQIIGKTPLTLFDHSKKNPTIASPLDRVKFFAINEAEFINYKQEKILRQ